MLFICLTDMPYGYYQLVRFVGLFLFGVLAFDNYRKSNFERFIIFLGLVILFQPFIKISLGRTLWNVVDVVVGIWLFYESFTTKKTSKNKSKTMEKKIKIPSAILLVLLAIVFSGIACYITEKNREKALLDINQKVEDIFQGKAEICDYSKQIVKGNLRHNSLIDPYDNEDKELYEYFDCNSGGWTVYTLRKTFNGFEEVWSTSTDMGFKVPEKNYHEGVNYGFGYTSPSYEIPTFRGTVQEAYNGALNHVAVNNKNNSYLAGSLNAIQEFDFLHNELYFLKSFNSWESDINHFVYNNMWIVWYKNRGWNYEITFAKKEYQKRLYLNIGIAIGLSFICFLLVKYGRKIEIK